MLVIGQLVAILKLLAINIICHKGKIHQSQQKRSRRLALKRRTNDAITTKRYKGHTNAKVIYREALFLNMWRVTVEDESASKGKCDL